MSFIPSYREILAQAAPTVLVDINDQLTTMNVRVGSGADNIVKELEHIESNTK